MTTQTLRTIQAQGNSHATVDAIISYLESKEVKPKAVVKKTVKKVAKKK